MNDYHHQTFHYCHGIIGLLDTILNTDGNLSSFINEMKHHVVATLHLQLIIIIMITIMNIIKQNCLKKYSIILHDM